MNLKRVYSLFGAAVFIAAGLIRVGWASDGLTPTVVIEEKIYLERVLEAKGQRALDAILGPRKAQLTIVVDANPSAIENIETAPGKKQESSFTWRDPKSGDSILPGFHEETGNIPVPLAGGRSSRISTVSRFIQKISGTIVADRTVPEEDAKNVREALFGVLALDPERGDTLQLIRGNFPSEIKQGIISSLSTAYVALLFGIIGLAVIYFAFKTARSLNTSVKVAEQLLLTKAARSSTEEQHDQQEKTPSSSPDSKTLETTPPPIAVEEALATTPTSVFGTLGESSALAVASFLADQPASKAAALLSVLRPDTAGTVLALLAPTFRQEVFKALGQNFNVSDEQKETLAPPLAEFVRTFVHGPNVLVEIYESAPESTQNRIAEDLAKTAPSVLAEIQAAVLKPDELWALPPDQWVTLATEIPAEDLAAALQEAPPADRDRLAASLPGDLAALVTQHLKFSGTLVSAKVVQSRRKLFAAARALRQAGKITFTRVVRA
jgi:hypothetical protein